MKKIFTVLFLLSSFVWGQVYISEYSDAGGSGNYIYEFVEIYNDANSTADVSGYVLRQQNATHSFTLPSSTAIPAKGFLIIGRKSNQADFESFWGVTFSSNVTYVNSGDKCPQINGDEVFLFEDNLGNNVDPLPDGAYTAEHLTKFKRVKRLSTGNSASDYDGTDDDDNSTPGSLETDQALPVELTTFSASVVNNNVELNWETATEVNNYGFSVERKPETGDWSELGFVEGHGNSNSPKHYTFTDSEIGTGKYFYRLKQIDIDGSFEYSDVIEVDMDSPVKYELSQNFPNPFNPTTSIQFSLPETGKVKLAVYNVIGEQVAVLVNKNMEAGFHNARFDASKLNSGIYIYKLEVNNFTQIRKMMLVK